MTSWRRSTTLKNTFTVLSGTLTCVLCRTTLMAKWNLLPPAPTLYFSTCNTQHGTKGAWCTWPITLKFSFHNLLTKFIRHWYQSHTHTHTLLWMWDVHNGYSSSPVLLLCSVLQNVARWSRMPLITLHGGLYLGLDAHQMERMRKMEGEGQERWESWAYK